MSARLILTCDGPPRTTGDTCTAWTVMRIIGSALPKGWTRDGRGGHRCPSCTRDGR